MAEWIAGEIIVTSMRLFQMNDSREPPSLDDRIEISFLRLGTMLVGIVGFGFVYCVSRCKKTPVARIELMDQVADQEPVEEQEEQEEENAAENSSESDEENEEENEEESEEEEQEAKVEPVHNPLNEALVAIGLDPDEVVPPLFRCNITRDTLIDPAVASDGRIYEEKGIQAWIASRHTRGLPLVSPMNVQQRMGAAVLPILDVKLAMFAFREEKEQPYYGYIRTLFDARNQDKEKNAVVSSKQITDTVDIIKQYMRKP